MIYQITAWVFVVHLVSVAYGGRTWYLADTKTVQRIELTPEVKHEQVFAIDDNVRNGKINCLAVNGRKTNNVFISDVHNQRIFSLTLDPVWPAPELISKLDSIVNNKVVYSMASDHVNNYLFFSTFNSIWRVRPDGRRPLIRMHSLSGPKQITTMEFSAWHNQLVWGTWDSETGQSAVETSNSPFITCSQTLFEGNSLISSFSLVNQSLYMLDVPNVSIYSLKIPARGPQSNTKPSAKRVFEAFNSSRAASLHVHNHYKVVFLDEDLKTLRLCEEMTCSDTPFETETTPVAWKVGSSPVDEVPYMVNLTSFKQLYFWPKETNFQFEVEPSKYVNKYIFRADIRIVERKSSDPSEDRQFVNGSKTAIPVTPKEETNKFNHLTDATTYMVDIFFKENFCRDSYFDFLASHQICTSPSEPYGFLYDGKYVFWNHSKKLPSEDWEIQIYRKEGSGFTFKNLSTWMLPSAIESDYVIYRLEVGHLKSNDTVTVFASYPCGDKVLSSVAVKYTIDGIDEVENAKFDRIAEQDKEKDQKPWERFSSPATSAILYGAIGFIIVGILFIIVHKAVSKYRIIRKQTTERNRSNSAFNTSVYFRQKSGTLRFGLTNEELTSRLSHITSMQAENYSNTNEHYYEEISENYDNVPMPVQLSRNSVTINDGYETLISNGSNKMQKRVEDIPEKPNPANCESSQSCSSSRPGPNALSAMTSEPNVYSEI